MRNCRRSRALLMDIPENLMVDILLRLPIKEIVMCKCTCRTFRHLISSPYFVQLHYEQGQISILVANEHYRQMDRTLYLIEPSQMNKCCSFSHNVIESNRPALNMKLDTVLKIPLCTDERSKNPNMAINAEASAFSGGTTKTKPTINLESKNYEKFEIVNSCNGFLCLTARFKRLTIICNPITNEYIKIPSPSSTNIAVRSGFGFCSQTKQYKVLQLSSERNSQWYITAAEVHILGTNSWKRICTPNARLPTTSSVYLNGILYYYYWHERGEKPNIFSFEFSTECFNLLPRPPIERCRARISLGVFGDCLCLLDDLVGSIDIWVQKSTSVEKYWTKLLSIEDPIKLTNRMCSYFKLVTRCSECEAFSLQKYFSNKIVFYDSQREEWRKFGIHRKKFKVSTILYTPSFISLKDVVPSANVMSISTWFKLPGESRPPYLKEET